MANDNSTRTFSFTGGPGGISTTGGVGETPGQAHQGADGTSTGPDKHGHYTCTKQPDNGQPGRDGGEGGKGGRGTDGLKGPSGTLHLGVVSGSITVEVGGGDGGQGGKGGPGGTGGLGGPPGRMPTGCTVKASQGPGGRGGQGGTGGPGGNGGDGGTVVIYYTDQGASINPIHKTGNYGPGGEPGDPGPPGPKGSGNLGGGKEGKPGEKQGAVGQVIIRAQKKT